MLVLNEEHQPIDRIAPFLLFRRERERAMTILRLGGRLVAYLPHARRAFYLWLLVIAYRPAQHISLYQFSPRHLRLTLAGRWEVGLVLGHWGLGMRLGRPLFWLKRLQPA